ncbi:hypothetical protein RGR602_PC02002 (plasmid) [Rhizobium gallicum bv. gallicum R602sp]|uniref:Uncharacterized protein n=1 Tax=Rhizobium gallicum bv. gallicum R602sp TaxID=1041138 RepID=A0A0B4XH27_9HYPH|nr:hypothetical protein RGR602_PC02002 [Rhizobium gallicum bv. gallicum R602sp]TDW32322.1 hypothetical protein EV128_107191 [Rhizobium azibense]
MTCASNAPESVYPDYGNLICYAVARRLLTPELKASSANKKRTLERRHQAGAFRNRVGS